MLVLGRNLDQEIRINNDMTLVLIRSCKRSATVLLTIRERDELLFTLYQGQEVQVNSMRFVLLHADIGKAKIGLDGSENDFFVRGEL